MRMDSKTTLWNPHNRLSELSCVVFTFLHTYSLLVLTLQWRLVSSWTVCTGWSKEPPIFVFFVTFFSLFWSPGTGYSYEMFLIVLLGSNMVAERCVDMRRWSKVEIVQPRTKLQPNTKMKIPLGFHKNAGSTPWSLSMAKNNFPNFNFFTHFLPFMRTATSARIDGSKVSLLNYWVVWKYERGKHILIFAVIW